MTHLSGGGTIPAKEAIVSGGVLGHKTRPVRKSASPRSAVPQLERAIMNMTRPVRTKEQEGLATTQLAANKAQFALGENDTQIRQHELCLRRSRHTGRETRASRARACTVLWPCYSGTLERNWWGTLAQRWDRSNFS